MDGRQLITQRAREYFADRLDDVLHMVRQDRQQLRGWQEPAHLRAVVRRAVREGGPPAPETAALALTDLGSIRGAGEPDPGQQREAFGQVLEAAAGALEKLARGAGDLTGPELAGLEVALLTYGRPALALGDGAPASVPPFWNLLEDQREEVERVQRGVGRIDLLGHPELDWAGTGFLVGETTLLTTRRVAEVFAERAAETWQFRPGITAWMDYRPDTQRVASAGFQVRAVIGVHETYDLALLEVEPPQANGSSPLPVPLAANPPERPEGRPVYLVGYPVRDGRRAEPELVARVFRDVYGVKRVQPGLLRGSLQFREVQLLRHDCGPLGVTAGSPLIDLETHQVLGVQTSGRYLDAGTAVPLAVLREAPLFRKAGVTFAEATQREREVALAQLERLSRSRYWNEARDFLANLSRRAFGDDAPR